MIPLPPFLEPKKFHLKRVFMSQDFFLIFAELLGTNSLKNLACHMRKINKMTSLALFYVFPNRCKQWSFYFKLLSFWAVFKRIYLGGVVYLLSVGWTEIVLSLHLCFLQIVFLFIAKHHFLRSRISFITLKWWKKSNFYSKLLNIWDIFKIYLKV